MPGLLPRALMHKPESSDMTGYFTNFEKNLTFSFELAAKVFPVSLGLLIFNIIGDIFLYFLEINRRFP